MPRNPVIENVCDRCTRAWYTKTDEKQPEVDLKLSYAIGGNLPLTADFKCLCEGCQKTVLGLIESITKVMTKSAPIRGAKKVASEDKSPPATSTPTPAKDVNPSISVTGQLASSMAGKVPSTSVPPSGAPSSQHPKR